LDPVGGGLGGATTGEAGAAAFAANGATSAIAMAQLNAPRAVVVILNIIFLLFTGSDPYPVGVAGTKTSNKFHTSSFFSVQALTRPAPGQADLIELAWLGHSPA